MNKNKLDRIFFNKVYLYNMSNLFIDKLGKEFDLKVIDDNVIKNNKNDIKNIIIVVLIIVGLYLCYKYLKPLEHFLFTYKNDELDTDITFNRPVLNPGVAVDKQWNGTNYLGDINNGGVIASDGEQSGVVYDNMYNKYQFKGPEYVYNNQTYINAGEYIQGMYN